MMLLRTRLQLLSYICLFFCLSSLLLVEVFNPYIHNTPVDIYVNTFFHFFLSNLDFVDFQPIFSE